MTPTQALQQHQQLCDELHQCALEENRFLRQHQRPLSAELVEKKRELLGKLDQSLSALRTVPAGRTRDPEARVRHPGSLLPAAGRPNARHQGFSFQPSTNPTPKHQRAATSGRSRA